jgi:DNA polymerase-3 subunit chi
MTEIRFYHLERSTLETALPTMLERVVERGQRALVVLGTKERLDALNMHLWTYRAEKFLPHGSAEDGFAEQQPVFLSLDDANPNKAQVLFLADGATSGDPNRFDLCVELFDGGDDEAVAAARQRWRGYKDAGHQLTYWRQTDQGWKQEATG